MTATGTVSDGNSGMSAMRLLSHGATALKAVVLLPQGVVHLVAGARCYHASPPTNDAETTAGIADVHDSRNATGNTTHSSIVSGGYQGVASGGRNSNGLVGSAPVEHDCGEVVTTFENNVARGGV
jgi:hypothetical protein